MSISSIEKQYQELKIELKICKIGGLFLALYHNKEVPKLIIQKLRNDNDLKDFFQFPLYMDEKKVPFPILFEQTFKQMGNQSNIFYVLGIEENLSSEAVNEFLGYLQYTRERFKAKTYSLVFWITPDFEKKLFFQAPDFHHWVFGTYDFTDLGDDELNNLTSSVNKESFDTQKINRYLEKVIWQYKNWKTVKENNDFFLLEPMERADLYNYYVQSYCIDKNGKEQLLDNFLIKFIEDSEQSSLIALGDFGTGKSSFSIHYFIELAKKYLNEKSKRIPIFISLKDYRGKLNIEEFMIKEFYNKFDIRINFSIFQQLALEGKFIFFIDGFDEMASLTDQEITIQNLKELTKLSFENVLFMTKSQDENYKTNKIFLTSRTHYFLTESQEKDILKADYTVLYRNYATKSNYEITRIKFKEFNEAQIREYIQKHTNNEEITTQYLTIIKDTYNLKELSNRPLLLEIILKTMPILSEKNNINPVDLYRAYTNIWIERDDWRSQMKPQGKRNFMWEMAVDMFKLGGDFSLHYSKINKPNNKHLKLDFKLLDNDYYKYESTTCSFLNRDAEGNYKFIHKSFMEYFVAESFYYHFLNNNNQIIDYLSFNTEIKLFFKKIIALHKPKLDSMNLRTFDLAQIDLSSVSLSSAYLSGADLSGAYLSGADLSGADLSGADLRDAYLSDAYLSGADLSGADLRGARIISADLRSANLNSVNLSGANLSGSYLSDANLCSANLSSSNLGSAYLSGASFNDADLTRANLSHTSLGSADLSSANLSDVFLSNANLGGANLGGANLSRAYLSGANLIQVKNITHSQLRYTHFWDQAFYKGYWDENKSDWIIDEQANQEYIEKLKKSIE